jgi:uncharacterized protein YjbI with pentapeptide repeats/predicted nucleic acid-binding protein
MKKILIDTGLVIELFLGRKEWARQVDNAINYLKSNYFQVYVTSLSIAHLHFYVGIDDPEIAEKAIIWLEQELKVQVIDIESSYLLQVADDCLNYGVESLAAQTRGLDGILTLSPNNYQVSLDYIYELDKYIFLVDINQLEIYAIDKKEELELSNSALVVCVLAESELEKKHDNNLKILIDTGLVIELFIRRKKWAKEVDDAINYLKSNYFQVYVTSLSIAHLHFYVGIDDPEIAENAIIWLEQELKAQVIDIESTYLQVADDCFDYGVELLAAQTRGLDGILTLSPNNYQVSLDHICKLDKFDSLINQEKYSVRNFPRFIAGQEELNFYKDLIIKLLQELNLDQELTYESVLVNCLFSLKNDIKNGKIIPIPSLWFSQQALKAIERLHHLNSLDNVDKEYSSIIKMDEEFSSLYCKLRFPDVKARHPFLYFSMSNAKFEEQENKQIENEFLLDPGFSSRNFKNRKDLSGLDLSLLELNDANFEEADLKNVNFSGANLRNAVFKRADLSGANLRRADLENADFSESVMQGSNLGGANIQNANFEKAKLSKSTLKGANLMDASLKEAELMWCNFRGAKLQRANLHKANLSNADLIRTNLKGADLSYAILHGATLNNAVMNGANLNYADLRPNPKNINNVTQMICVKLANATFHKARLDNVYARRSNFGDANLDEAILESAKLVNTNFEGASLNQTNLKNADLGGAILTKASLKNAILEGVLLRGASLKSANLEQAQLQNSRLHGAYLYAVNLNGANLSNCQAHRANFDQAQLVNANLASAELVNASFIEADLSEAILIGAKLSRAILDGAILVKADLSSAELVNASFVEADLSEAILIGAKLSRAILDGAILVKANLSSSILQGASLKKADLTEANLEKSRLEGAYFKDAILNKSNLNGADLSGCRLKRAKLIEIQLNDSILHGVDLRYALLQKAKLNGAILSSSNLIGTDCTGAELRSVDLSWTNLSSTLLIGVDLSNANLTGANLSGARMNKAKLYQTNLSKARFLATDLQQAALTQVNCHNTYFADANLTFANLIEVDLRRAYLAGASFKNAMIYDSKLERNNLIDTSFIGTKLDYVNIYNDGIDINLDNKISRDLTNDFIDSDLLSTQYTTEFIVQDRLVDAQDMLNLLEETIKLIIEVKQGCCDKPLSSNDHYERMQTIKSLSFYIELASQDMKNAQDILEFLCQHKTASNCHTLELIKYIHKYIISINERRIELIEICFNPQKQLDISTISLGKFASKRGLEINYLVRATA